MALQTAPDDSGSFFDDTDSVPVQQPGTAAPTLASFGGGYGNYPNYPVEATAEAGAPIYNQRQAEFEGLTDWGRIEADLRREAAAQGVEYHPSDLEGIRRNAGYDAAHLGSGGLYAGGIEKFTNSAMSNYGQRANNTPGPSSGGGGGAPVPRMSSFGSEGGGPSAASGVTDTAGLYTPWTRAFTPSLGAFPSDVMDKWDQTYTPLDPNTIKDNPLVQARINLGRDAIEKGAAARGTLLTPGVQSHISTMAGDIGSDEYWRLRDTASQDYLNAFNVFSGDRSRRAGEYGNQWMRDFSKEGFDYGTSRDNQTIPFGMGVSNRQLGQADRQLGQGDRSLDLSYLNFGETQRMNDFGQYRWADDAYWDRLFRGAGLGLPS